MKLHKRFLSALLALCMVLLLAPTTAFADGAQFKGTVYINGHFFVWTDVNTVSREKPVYYVNGAETISKTEPENSEWNAKMDYTTGTLTLKNYSGGGIAVWNADNDLTVELIGTNVISTTATGYQGKPRDEKSWAKIDVSDTGASVGKNFIITSDDTASLAVEYYAVNTEKNVALDTGNMGLVIKGKASVNVEVSTLAENTTIPYCVGVRCSDNFQLLDNASLNVKTNMNYSGTGTSTTTFGVVVSNTKSGSEANKTLEVNTTGSFNIDCDDYVVGANDSGRAVCLAAYNKGGTCTATLTNVGTMKFTYPTGQTSLNQPRGRGAEPAGLFSASTNGHWTVNSNTPGTTTYTDGISALTGTVKLTADANNTTLTATVSGSNNTGTLFYKWCKGGTEISKTVNSTYTYTYDDIGSTFTCEVTSSVETDSISSSLVAPKQDKKAPAAFTALDGRTSGSLTAWSGSQTKYEWAISKTNTAPETGWTTDSTIDNIGGAKLSPGTIYYAFRRYAATNQYNTSPASPGLMVSTRIMPFFKTPNATTAYERQVAKSYATVPIPWVINPGVPESTIVRIYIKDGDEWTQNGSDTAANWRNGGYIRAAQTTGEKQYRVTVDGYGSAEFKVNWTTTALTGTVTFGDSQPRFDRALYSIVSDSNNTGTLSYQWQRGATQGGDFTNIPSAADRGYTPVADDIGKYLRCVVTSDVQTGSISGTTANPVIKVNPAYFYGKPTVTEVGTNSITVTNDATLEFAASTSSDSASLTATDWHSGEGTTLTLTGLTGNTIYYVYARQKATDTLEPSNANSIQKTTSDANCFTLTVSGGYGDGRYDPSFTVTLRPYGSQGYKFLSWQFTNTTTGADVTADITVTYANEANKSEGTIFMPAYDLTATAVYSTDKTAPIGMQMKTGEGYTYKTDYLVGEELDLSNAYIEYWYDDGLGNIHYSTRLTTDMLPENPTELAGNNQAKRVTYDGFTAFIYVINVTAPDGVTSLMISNPASKTVKVQKGQTFLFSKFINSSGTGYDAVTWTVTGNSSSNTTIGTNTATETAGLLTVASDETAAVLTVTVTSDKDPNFSDSVTVYVTSADVYVLDVYYGSNSAYHEATQYAAGDTVTITAPGADPDAEHTSFVRWAYIYGVTLADPTAQTITFTMPAANAQMTATYLPTVQYTADSSAISGGALTVDAAKMALQDSAFKTAYDDDTVTYQWYRVGETVDTLLTGQAGVSLGLAKADVGSSYYVKVSYSSITLTSDPQTVVAAEALTGRVLITRGDGDDGYTDYAVIGDTLTATLSDTNNTTGTLSYQWRRGDSSSAGDISGATGSTYTLTAEDYYRTIYCYVTSSIQSEGVGAWYYWGNRVRKQAGPAAPTGITAGEAPTYPNACDGTVNGTDHTMAFNRYSNWGNEACVDGSTGGFCSGGWCFFYPETAERYASEETWVTIPDGYVRAPQLSPNGGGFLTNTLDITATSETANAAFLYTTDGTDPTDSLTSTNAEGGTIPINASCTVKVVAYYYGSFSEVTTAVFTQADKPATPEADVPSGNYVDNFTLHLTGTAGATIYYTIGGTGIELPADPTSSSTAYTSSGISIASDTLGTVTTIKAIAIAGSMSSSVVTLTYTKAEGVTVSGTAVSWNNTDNAAYRLYPDATADADIKADIKLASPTLGTPATAKGTPAASGSRYAQTYSFTAVTAGSYKLAIYKPGKYVPKIVTVTVSSANIAMDEQKLWLYGDVNDDGKVNGTDAGQIKRKFANLYPNIFTTGSEQDQADRLLAANVTLPQNGDAIINGTDAGQIQRYFASLTPTVFGSIS